MQVEAGKTYYLRETTAPDGYELATQYVKIVVSEEGEIAEWKVCDNGTTDKISKEDKEVTEEIKWTEEEEIDGTWPEIEGVEISLILALEDKPTTKIKLHKVDEEENPLPGAVFTLYECTVEWENEDEVIKVTETGNTIETKPTDENGDTIVAINEGKTYLIKETKAPEVDGTKYALSKQYVILEEGVDVFVVENYQNGYQAVEPDKEEWKEIGTGSEETEETEETKTEEGTETEKTEEDILIALQLEDKPPVKIKLRKIDKETGEGIKTSPKPIFTVYKYVTEGEISEANIIFNTPTVDDDGYSNEIPLEYNTKYVIVESDSPDGYSKTDQCAIIEVDSEGNVKLIGVHKLEGTKIGEAVAEPDWEEGSADGGTETSEEGKELFVLTLKDEAGLKIKLKKIDKETGNGLSGAKFTVNGKEYETKEKDGCTEEIPIEAEADTINININETAAPEGYIGLDKPLTITLEKDANGEYKVKDEDKIEGAKVEIKDGIVTVEIENQKAPTIQLKKVDKAGNPLQNATFTIDGPVEGGPFATGGDGLTEKITIKSNEDTIQLSITETPPAGYIGIEGQIKITLTKGADGNYTATLAEEKEGVTVGNDGETIVITVENELMGEFELNLLKVDGNDNKPLDGAVFSISGPFEEGNSLELTTSDGGKIGPLKLQKLDTSTPQEYTITIQEIEVPPAKKTEKGQKEYILNSQPIVIKITVNANGTITGPELVSDNSGVRFETSKDAEGNVTMQVTMSNYTEIDIPKVPLLMYLEGQIWIDEKTGKQSEIDNEYT